MENYNVGKILNIDNIDFCILSIIPYKSNNYILASEYIINTVPNDPKMILLKDKKYNNMFGAKFEIIEDQNLIKNVLKNI